MKKEGREYILMSPPALNRANEKGVTHSLSKTTQIYMHVSLHTPSTTTPSILSLRIGKQGIHDATLLTLVWTSKH